jgi:hypothetical protein
MLMTFKDDLKIVSEEIGYLFAPGSHHTTTKIIPASRLFNEGFKDRLSHGKPTIKRKLNDIRRDKNILFRKYHPNQGSLEEQISRVCALMIWNIRGIFDRIGELDRPGSFMDTYLNYGPVCARKPDPVPRGAPRYEQNLYKQKKNVWEADSKRGYKLLKNLRTHVHEITFASDRWSEMYIIYTDLRTKSVFIGMQQYKIDAIGRISKWIHSRFSMLEREINEAERCVLEQNVLFHGTFLPSWRNNSNYKFLKFFLLSKYVGHYNKNEQRKYLQKINDSNRYL